MSRSRQIPLVDGPPPQPVLAHGADHPTGFEIPPHRHPFDQLVHAAAGVMTVDTPDGLWVVPPERAVYVPAQVPHGIRMTGAVELRTLYLAPGTARPGWAGAAPAGSWPRMLASCCWAAIC